MKSGDKKKIVTKYAKSIYKIKSSDYKKSQWRIIKNQL